MNTRGRHLLVEYTGCDFNVLDDLKRIESLMREAATAAGTTIVASVFQPFVPQGVTGVVVVEESHLSIHTWPEYGYAAVDFFTCGDGSPDAAHQVLFDGLVATRAEKMFVERGASVTGPSVTGASVTGASVAVPNATGRGMRLRSHTTEERGVGNPCGDARPPGGLTGRAQLNWD